MLLSKLQIFLFSLFCFLGFVPTYLVVNLIFCFLAVNSFGNVDVVVNTWVMQHQLQQMMMNLYTHACSRGQQNQRKTSSRTSCFFQQLLHLCNIIATRPLFRHPRNEVNLPKFWVSFFWQWSGKDDGRVGRKKKTKRA